MLCFLPPFFSSGYSNLSVERFKVQRAKKTTARIRWNFPSITIPPSVRPSVRLRRDSLRHTTSSFLQHKCLRTPFLFSCLFLHVLRHAGKPLRRKTNQNNNNNNTNMCVTSTFGFRQSKNRKKNSNWVFIQFHLCIFIYNI